MGRYAIKRKRAPSERYKGISPAGVDLALARLAQRDLSATAPEVFVDDYLPLLRLFKLLGLEDARGDSGLELVRAGCYAVYGWMPTMMKEPPGATKAADLLDVIRRSKRCAPTEFSSVLSIMDAVNGSVVGTSKFLHFAVPDVFPIWDSIVAGVFELRWPSQYSTPDAYAAYFEAVSGWLELGRPLPENFVTWLEGAAQHDRLGQVRRLEAALYLEGRLMKADAEREKK